MGNCLLPNPPPVKKTPTKSPKINSQRTISSAYYQKVEDSIRFPHRSSSFGRKELLSNPRSSQGDLLIHGHFSNRITDDLALQTPGWKAGLSFGSNAYSIDLRKSDELDSRLLDSNDEKAKKRYKSKQISPRALLDQPDNVSMDVRFSGLNPNEGGEQTGSDGSKSGLAINSTDMPNFKPYIKADTKIIKEVNKNDSFHLRFILESQIALVKSKQLNSSPIPAEFEEIYEETKKDHKLKIYLQSFITSDRSRVNKVMAEWHVPVKPEEFIKFMNNIDEQLKIGDNAPEVIKPVLVMNETPDEVYILYYVSYKKTADENARDFVYMRHSAKIDANSYGDCLISVQHPDCPVKINCDRCEYKLGGHTVKLASDKDSEKPVSVVRMYLELDFKVDLSAELARSYSQASLQDYIEKCIDRLTVLHPY